MEREEHLEIMRKLDYGKGYYKDKKLLYMRRNHNSGNNKVIGIADNPYTGLRDNPEFNKKSHSVIPVNNNEKWNIGDEVEYDKNYNPKKKW